MTEDDEKIVWKFNPKEIGNNSPKEEEVIKFWRMLSFFTEPVLEWSKEFATATHGVISYQLVEKLPDYLNSLLSESDKLDIDELCMSNEFFHLLYAFVYSVCDGKYQKIAYIAEYLEINGY